MRIIRSAAILTTVLAAPVAGQQPSPRDMLDALYLTVAYVEYCNLQVPETAAKQMARTGIMLESVLGLDRAGADASYQRMKETVVATPPDCAEGSADLAGIRAQLGIE